MPVEQCPTCPSVQCCSGGNVFFYSLNGSTVLYNDQTGFVFTCPPGFVCAPGQYPRTIIIPANTVTYQPPPSVFLSNPPPMVIPCINGNIIVYIPPGSTSQQIMALAQQAIASCVERHAIIQSNPTRGFMPPTQYFNNSVCVPVCFSPATLSGTPNPPLYISGNDCCLPSGVVPSMVSQTDADQMANNLLTDLITQAQNNGTIKCSACSAVPTDLFNVTMNIQSETLAFRSSGTPLVFTADYSTDDLYTVNMSNRAINTVGSSLEIFTSVYIPTVDRFVVLDSSTYNIVQITPDTLAIFSTTTPSWPVGHAPASIGTYNPQNGYLYIPMQTRYLEVYDPVHNTLVGQWDSGSNSTYILAGPTIDPVNKLLYAGMTTNSGTSAPYLYVFDISGNNPTLLNTYTIPPQNGHPCKLVNLLFCPDNGLVYCQYQDTLTAGNPGFLTRFNPNLLPSPGFQNTVASNFNSVSASPVYNPTSRLLFIPSSALNGINAGFDIYCESTDSKIGFILGTSSTFPFDATFISFNNSVGMMIGTLAQNFTNYG